MLPPEIRNEIYRLCLTMREPIRVARARAEITTSRKMPDGSDVEYSYASQFFTLKSTSLIRVRSNRKTRLPTSRAITTTLLRTNKKIHSEAVSILYRYNCFEFDNPLVGNGTSLAVIKVKKVDWRSFSHEMSLSVLAQLDRPRRLRFPTRSQSFCGSPNEHASHIRSMIAPFVQHMAPLSVLNHLCAQVAVT